MSIYDELEQANRDAPTWEEIRVGIIIGRLKSGNPEPLIKFMCEGGDMRQLGDYGLDIIARVLRGEKLKGRGAPKSERTRMRNINLLFEVAWFIEIGGFPKDRPDRSGKVTAYDKAVEVTGAAVEPRTVYNRWRDCDQDYYRAAVRDYPAL